MHYTIPNHRTLIAASIAALLSASYVRWLDQDRVSSSANASNPLPVAATPAARNPAALPNFSAIVAESGRAVVNITVASLTKVGGPGALQQGSSDPLSEFLRRLAPGLPQGEMPARGLGSGFIVDADGLIVTNAHVVDGASEVTVRLTDKRQFRAKVIGSDKPTDLALLRIDADDLPTVRIGNPDEAGAGDWVLAIGSPFGFENSVTAGIISAKARILPEENYVPFIQTDVAVNPGNSGGPLFNLKGEVIGINSQIYSRSGGYQGLSFAIPIDVALKIERQLLQTGRITRGRLGIGAQNVDQSLADSFGLDKPRGALIDVVEPDAPAAKAGLQAGDIILSLGGQDVDDSADLPPLIANLKPGSSVKLSIWRHGRPRDVTVGVSEMEDPATAAELQPLEQIRIGLEVRSLTDEESRRIDADSGLLVERSAGPAALAGIQPGDVVLGLNGHPVADARQLRELTAEADSPVAVLIQRGGVRMFVPVSL